jgi:hypothetical protein
MPQVTGNDARVLFQSTVQHQKTLKQTDEQALFFVQEAFKAMAEGQDFSIGERSIRVKDLGEGEMESLCKLSKRLFDKQKDLSVSADLLKNLETLNKKSYAPSVHKQLENLKTQIYANEAPETNKGVCQALQSQLLKEIKENAPKIERMRFIQKIKSIAIVASIAIAGVGAAAGGIALVVLTAGVGLAFLGGLLTIVGLAGAQFSPYIAFPLLKKGIVKLSEEELLQKNRMRAFELLKDEAKFTAFCEAKGITDPASVTFEQLMGRKDVKE